MTKAIFYDHPYQRALNTQVVSVDGDWVVLAATVFYPAGGGQPGDIGTIENASGDAFQVTDTIKGESSEPTPILHRVSEHLLGPGDPVAIEIDWLRRHRLMRMHTCMHLLCSLVPVPVTGGSVGELKSRLDFDMGDHKVDKEALTAELRALVDAGLAVTSEALAAEELAASPELVRTLGVQPPPGESIRMIRIAGTDSRPVAAPTWPTPGKSARSR